MLIAGDPEMTEYIKDFIRGGVTYITFRKVNGELRTMKCTLFQDLIPQFDRPVDMPPTKKVRVQKEGVISVYDLENEGWRSFREDRLLEAWKIVALSETNFTRIDLDLI